MIRVSASALVALALPHFLTRALDHDRFAAWALMLQIAAYANYLEFGLQTAVARYLAQAMERKENERRDRLVSTALLLLSGGALLSLILIAVLLPFLPQLFRQAPLALMDELRLGIAVLATTVALQLPLGVFTGVLIGLHRNEIPAMAIGGSRLLGAIGVIFAVRHTNSLVVLAAIYGLCNLVGGLAQLVVVRNVLTGLRLSIRLASRAMAGELARYCSTLTIWSFCMFLISGLDVTIVGHFDFAAVGAYSIATMLTAFLTGVNNSVYGAFLTPIAVLQERGEWHRIRNLVIAATRVSSFLNITATLIAFLAGNWLLRLWVGAGYAAQTLPFLEVLMVANSIRLVGAPLSAALMATDQQHYGLSGAVAEALSNVALSILGAILVGAIGVALGTLAGAIVGVVWTLALTISWLQRPIMSARTLFTEGLLRPMVCLSPLMLCIVGLNTIHGETTRVAIAAVALFCATIMTWRWGRLQLRHPTPSA